MTEPSSDILSAYGTKEMPKASVKVSNRDSSQVNLFVASLSSTALYRR